ncbi:hypothetical protein QR665_12175 [Acinetobacter gerneri]|uniref:hypothetical protein n=1 Tax=Acinetobacter gerneri TaxID=202952 RepID=UPI0029363E31|nr:hypothetical protein [Acinetobacter gerneri]MDV2440219.1 hypothetical protein [Acinetobacter gerneri]
MIEHVNPEFFKAFEHYKAMLEQFGKDHPITERAFLLTLHYTPEHIKKEMHQKAKELGLLPKPSGYLDNGTAVYAIEDIAKQLRISIEEAQAQLDNLLQIEQQLGIVTGVTLVDPNTVNKIQ